MCQIKKQKERERERERDVEKTFFVWFVHFVWELKAASNLESYLDIFGDFRLSRYAVASDTSGPGFKYSYAQFLFCINLFITNC